MKIKASTAALLALSSLLIAADHHGPEKEGSILGIVGVWKRDGKPLQFGNAINVGDKICAERPGSIIFSFKDGTVAYSCERNGCPSAPSCTRGVSEDDKKAINGLDRFYTAVLPLIRRDGDRLFSAVSGGSEVAEAVVALKGKQVDLSPMLSDLPPGTYGARFRLLAPTQGTPSALVNFEHAEGSPTLASVEDVTPGLYQVELFDREAMALGRDAWVLVSPPESYGEHCESFKQAVQMSGNWSSATDSRSVRAFLRAYLESMAQHQAGR